MMMIYGTGLFLLVAYAGLIIYYRQSWISIPDFQLPVSNDYSTLITVIIPARDEEENIAICLDSILAQNYPIHLFEVIVVDDFSTDRTPDIILSYCDKNVRLLKLKDIIGEDRINSYKKKAIEAAIEKSTGTLIVCTDADCIMPKTWLETIASFYEKHKPAFIAAPVAYHNETNFLKIFQSLDFMTLQGITGASVHKKFHSMCNGANLAYEKKTFYEVGGFKGIDNIASGDDMLLMHKIYSLYPERVLFLKSNEAIVQTKPMEFLKDFFNQRIRWASKADKYDDKRIFVVLALVYFFNLFIFLSGTIGIISTLANQHISRLVYYTAGLLVAKTIVELFFLYPVATFFSKQKLLWWFPLAQPFHVLYTIVAGWLGKFGSYKWKERKVK